MLSTVLKVLGGLLLLYAVMVFLAWWFQERLALPGSAGPLPAPSAFGMPEGERITVTTSDSVELKGWYLPPNPRPAPGSRAPGLIWFYGNLETVGDIAPILRELRPAGTGMVVLDYRGYGESAGKPTEEGLYRDGEAAWEFITAQPEIDGARVAAYGRSIGSVVALYLATEQPVRAVVLDSPFSSGRDMAKRHYRFLPTGLVRLKLDNVERAKKLTVPLLVFHGTEDFIAPLPMGRAVAEAGRAELVLLQGAGHNSTYDLGGASYREKMHSFLAEHLR